MTATRNDCPACGGGLVSEPKGAPMRCTQCAWHLITLAEWKKLPPRGQGYLMYMQSSWPTSELAKAKNPYAAGSHKWAEFCEGEQHATRSAQDGEE